MKILVLFLTLLITVTTNAQETRQHDAHAHGFSELNVVMEDNELVIELISPSANIVGFEYTPTMQEDIQAVERAMDSLNNADILFEFTAAAQCEIQHIDIESSLDSDQHEHEEDHKAGHDDEGHEGDGHEDDDHEGDGHEDDGHEQGHDNETHSEFHVQYEYDCKNAEELKELDVLLFNVFPLTESLNVQMLSNSGQTAMTLNKDKHLVEF